MNSEDTTMPNGHGVKKETYVGADEETFRALTYDILDSINSNTCVKYEDHEKRIKGLEKRKRRDTGIAAGSGFSGGFMAMVIQKVTGLW